MKLIKARIRGLGTLAESRWFELCPELNLFRFPHPKYGHNFLRILQTINPTYAIETIKPFADFPQITVQNGYQRRVNPTKRTVALAVFIANSHLVKELGNISDWLYETDRIEIGRRLDYSRWINFVELASSTRWSEISIDIKSLLEQVRQSAPEFPAPLGDIQALQPTDRIKDDLLDNLAQWLQRLPAKLQESSQQLIATTITAVMRAAHFQVACNIVRTRLPLFVVLGSFDPDSASLHDLLQLISNKTESAGRKISADKQIFLDGLNDQLATLQFSGMRLRVDDSSTGVLLLIDGHPVQLLPDKPLAKLKQMQATTYLAMAFSKVVNKAEPILLFAGPEQSLPHALYKELADFVAHIAQTCQCLYSWSYSNIFSDDIAGRRHNAADFILPKEQ